MRWGSAERRLAAERSRAEDMEEAGRGGELFGLGDVEDVVRYAEQTLRGAFGDFLMGLVFAFGLPALALPFAASLALVVRIGVPVGCVALCFLGACLPGSYRETGGRLCLYSGGVVQLLPGEPEPRVLGWADVADVVLTAQTDTDGRRQGRAIEPAGGHVGLGRGVGEWQAADCGGLGKQGVVPRMGVRRESGVVPGCRDDDFEGAAEVHDGTGEY
jgi:hypothetical protein